jgi:hypothetical protein
MTWQARVDHIRGFYDRQGEPNVSFQELIALRRYAHEHRTWGAVDGVAYHIAEMVLLGGPLLAREVFAEVSGYLPNAVAAYLAEIDPNAELEPTLYELTDAANAFGVIGFPSSPELLRSLGPLLPRVPDERDWPRWRWKQGFTAVALDDRWVWGPIAGYMPNDPVPFHAGATFGPNLQGLLGHLGAARAAKATFADVEPAWRSFMATADPLINMGQLDYSLILWVARIVFHDLGGQPLRDVAQLLHVDIQRCIAAGE